MDRGVLLVEHRGRRISAPKTLIPAGGPQDDDNRPAAIPLKNPAHPHLSHGAAEARLIELRCCRRKRSEAFCPVDLRLHLPFAGIAAAFIELGRFDDAIVAGKKRHTLVLFGVEYSFRWRRAAATSATEPRKKGGSKGKEEFALHRGGLKV